MPLGMEVGLCPGEFVLNIAPKFLAHVYCGQTAGWIEMELGMEVGLGPGHIVLDGDPAPLPTSPPPISRSLSIGAQRLYVS